MPPCLYDLLGPSSLEWARGHLPPGGWMEGRRVLRLELLVHFTPSSPRWCLAPMRCNRPWAGRLPQDPLPTGCAAPAPDPRPRPSSAPGPLGVPSCVLVGLVRGRLHQERTATVHTESRDRLPRPTAPPKSTCQSQQRFRPALPGRVAPDGHPRGGGGQPQQAGPPLPPRPAPRWLSPRLSACLLPELLERQPQAAITPHPWRWHGLPCSFVGAGPGGHC